MMQYIESTIPDHLLPSAFARARESYRARSPLAQFKEMFGTERGYKAMSDAGVSGGTRTVGAWLSGEQAPSAANREAISRAYQAMRRGGTPEWVRNGEMKIDGRVGYGNDVRDRGSQGTAPLLVDLSAKGDPGAGERWDSVDAAIADGASDDDLEELVAEGLIAEDIGDSYPWSFPGGGGGYTVRISS